MPVDNNSARTIFLAALERANLEERAQYLAKACGDDAALLHRVEVMLRAHDEPGAFLSDDQHDPQATASLQPNGPIVGTIIAARYKLLEQIGEGGMGTVWVAEQTHPVKRKVALKVIKPGMDSKSVLARFEAERQALALMDHPNIAKVLDGGLTEAGRPFFVMEYVKGVPITQYCDAANLTVPERLQLFIQVCQAVQHAHQKGIIHRDLKPSNILVAPYDDRPVPKVIDFGLAKAMHQSLTEHTLHTSHGSVLGTPLYMSPEQAQLNNLDVDTRSDIYSLGVLLYELLTGTTPVDKRRFKEAAWDEIRRIIREEEPPRPSTRLSSTAKLPSLAASRQLEPARLSRLVRGDLDWIVMKALEKDRKRRYESANGFAADVQRYLAGEAVLAVPPSTGYRVSKFIRRYRAAVLTTVAFAMVLLASTALSTWLAIVANRARVEANVQRDTADEARKAEGERVKERDEALVKEAERLKERDEALETARNQLDTSNFLLAVTAYDNSNVLQARQRLGSIEPKNRGWEWHYLRRKTIGGIFTLYGHTEEVTSVAYSPDGMRILTGSADKTAKVWDARRGTLLLELKGHTDRVSSVAFSPDGMRILTVSRDNTAKVWDARTGTPQLELKGHTNLFSCGAFSPDGTRIVSGSVDSTVKVWDARTGTPQLELKEHTERVSSVAFSPDGMRILTGSWDDKAKVWDARTGTPLLELNGSSSVAFSPDGTRIVSGSSDDKAKVWDARTGTPLLELKGHIHGVSSVVFSPDGMRILTGSWDNTAKVWDARTGTPQLELKGHTGFVSSVAFSPDGTRIVSGSMDSTAKVWDARTGTPQLELKGLSSYDNCFAFSADGMRFVTGGIDNTARVWDAWTGTVQLELKGHKSLVSSVAFSPDGTRILTGSNDNTAKVWDARTGTTLLELKRHTSFVSSVAFSPDGKRIATAANKNEVKVWDARSGTLLLELEKPEYSSFMYGPIKSVAFSPDGMRIVTGLFPDMMMVWDGQSGKQLLELKNEDWPKSLALSLDGKRIVTTSFNNMVEVRDGQSGTPVPELKEIGWLTNHAFNRDGSRMVIVDPISGKAKIYDVRTGTPLLELKTQVKHVEFTPDGTRIVTFLYDNTAKFWDARSSAPVLELKGHTNFVWSQAYSPDGTRIVTGSLDGTAKVWDPRSGVVMLELKGHKGGVISVAYSPDGSKIVTGSHDDTVKVWEARRGEKLLDLKGHETMSSAAYSSDGTRIVVKDPMNEIMKIWDAQTGQILNARPEPSLVNFFPFKLNDKPKPQTSEGDSLEVKWSSKNYYEDLKKYEEDLKKFEKEMEAQPIIPISICENRKISPDGRFIAYLLGNKVEIIPVQPDAEEIAYRELHTRPDPVRYQEGYLAAIAANDAFAARFYLKLLPQEKIAAPKPAD